MNFRIQTSTDESHLEQILVLQKKNLPRNISIEEKEEQGFVTCDHDLALLAEMNTPYPHTIAVSEGKVVGYTLVMLPSLRDRIAVLKTMFDKIDQQCIDGLSLKEVSYFTMGQVCVDKAYRSSGVFRDLYESLFLRMKNDFDYCITEIATENRRSLRAHEKVGFQLLHSYIDKMSQISWEIVICKL